MNKVEALKQLQALGTAQNRKVYARHGVTGDACGVSYANLEKLRKSIEIDHALAVALWDSGNHDARVLATMIADPEQASASLLDRWVKELDNYVLTDALSGLAAKSPSAEKRSEKWVRSKKEFVATAGWNVVTRRASAGAIDARACADALKTIEGGIGSAPNRARYAMNSALIQIGLVSPALEKKALASAKRIGEVEVDHGETGCKTPFAPTYLPKAAAHRCEVEARRKKKASAKKPAKKPAR